MNQADRKEFELIHEKIDNIKEDIKDMKHDMSMMQKDSTSFDYDARKTYFNYDFLKAKENTTYKEDIPVTDILLNLTGNMQRYVWSINGVPLSETDKIKIKSGEVTRITLNNLTMMHHPMHLHGHYFRVINENGERSPLKWRLVFSLSCIISYDGWYGKSI